METNRFLQKIWWKHFYLMASEVNNGKPIEEWRTTKKQWHILHHARSESDLLRADLGLCLLGFETISGVRVSFQM
jgi:hypothetical protein